MDDKAYFSLYEDRYRRLREQGVEDWVSNPEELKSTIKNVDEFLNYTHCQPSKTSIIEFGCGQGHLAHHLLEQGYKYFGVDISESAIKQAKKKNGVKGINAFLLADITNLKQLPNNSSYIAIDNECFHMLITDEHRKKYLSEVKRVLKNNGKAFFRESYRSKGFKNKILNLEEFTKTTHTNYITLYDYTAYVDGKMRKIKLPRVPARANNEEGYRKEFMEADFTINYFEKKKYECIFYACVFK